MSWTYSGNPSDSAKDEVRFLLGDIKEGSGSLSDEEIAYLLGLNDDDAYRTAAEAADRMAVRFLGLSATSKKIGDLALTTQYTEQSMFYAALSEKLMKGRTRFSIGAPVWKDTSDPAFTRDMFDWSTQDELNKKTGF